MRVLIILSILAIIVAIGAKPSKDKTDPEAEAGKITPRVSNFPQNFKIYFPKLTKLQPEQDVALVVHIMRINVIDTAKASNIEVAHAAAFSGQYANATIDYDNQAHLSVVK